MKRDLNYLREFLQEYEGKDGDFRFAFEEKAYIDGAFRETYPEGWSIKKHFHYELLKDAGFVVELEGDYPPYNDGYSSTVSVRKFRISNSGHDYLDAIRDDGIWEKTKEAVAESGGNAALEIIKSLALGFIKKKISESTGIKV